MRARSLLHFPHLQSFNILQSLLVSARLRPARASSEGLGWLAGYICDLAAPLGVTAPSGVALSFTAQTKKPRSCRGFVVSSRQQKARRDGRAFGVSPTHVGTTGCGYTLSLSHCLQCLFVMPRNYQSGLLNPAIPGQPSALRLLGLPALCGYLNATGTAWILACHRCPNW